jgi:uncharacterized repeat protein (TIGR03803 family)
MQTPKFVAQFQSSARRLLTVRRSHERNRTQASNSVTATRTLMCLVLLMCAGVTVAAHAQTLTTLVTFNSNNGSQPSGLKQATSGNFFGTTSAGGADGDGEVFEMTLTGGLTILHSFDVTDGIDPAGLTSSSSNYYGTTADGGANGDGVVYEITPTGVFTLVHSFDFTDGDDPGGLKLGSDGNFYGTTQKGGANGDGEVYKITPSGTVTVLHSFDSSDGAKPKSGLVQGTDGNYYGTTSQNGPGMDGTVFKITPSGTLTTLHSFSSTDGDGPGGLLQSTVDGNFYGTTTNGGGFGDGVVYKMTPSGALTVLHSFDVTDGAFPGTLIEGTDGNYYGTTTDGGANGDGEVYKMTPAGAVTVLHSFDVTDGEVPGALAQGFDGNFYGATVGKPPTNDGTIYKLTVTHTLPGPMGITTLAGNGTQGYSGDGGPATSAELSAPDGVAVDTSGNIYIGDLGNNRVRKVTVATGDISTVAGDGTGGYSGDGGLATKAELSSPEGVAVDHAGNIYIADHTNSRIRKVTVSTGIITTVAGDGTTGYSGDGGLATKAELCAPEDVTVDSAGNIYIADSCNNRIRKVTASTGIITTVAGDGKGGYSGDGGQATSAELSDPIGVGLDTANNIYIGDFSNNRIRKVTVSTGIITTVAGDGKAGYSGDGGPATSAELNFPGGVEVDPAGNIYIADYGNSRIRKVTALTGFISTVGGDGVAGYSGDGGAATAAELNIPPALALDTVGNIYVADRGNNRIRAIGY